MMSVHTSYTLCDERFRLEENRITLNFQCNLYFQISLKNTGERANEIFDA